MKQINGFYSVAEEIFYNKILALVKGTKLNTFPQYHFYDDVFDKTDKTQLGKKPLSYWYKERAIQLRDKYDYLILSYSGGSDSHNILQTFLKNKIKLDCVFVHWHLKFLDKNLYTPNQVDTTSVNFNSEWDLVIKKDLEYLNTYHPEIKIEIKDYTDTATDSFYQDNLFETNSNVMTNLSRGLKLHTFSDTEKIMVDKGLKVAVIFGAEKPNLVVKQNKAFFYFNDKGFCGIPNPINPDGLEYFYVTPDMPNVTIEQTYRLLEFYKNNIPLRYLFQAKSERIDSDIKNWPLTKHLDEYKLITNIIKDICYPYWDSSRFQADKAPPESFSLLPGFKSWDNLLVYSPEFVRYSSIWKYHWESYYNNINKNWLWSKNDHMVFKTKWHFIGDV